MLAVLLTILKVLGIILLVLLALVLVVVLVVLFVPIRYRAKVVKLPDEEGKKLTDVLSFDASVTWLLHILSIRVGFHNGKLTKSMKLSGIDLSKDQKKKKKEPKKGNPKPLREFEDKKKRPAAADEKTKEQTTAKTEEDVEQKESESVAQGVRVESTAVNSAAKKKQRPFSNLFWKIGDRIYGVWKRVRAKLRNAAEKIKKILAKLRYWLDFLEDERTQNALALVLKEFGGMLKGILPRKAKGYVRYGSADVYKTGEIMAILSAAYYPIFGNAVAIYPDFEQKTLEADVELKGRIVIAQLVGAALKLILNKNVKYVILFVTNKEE